LRELAVDLLLDADDAVGVQMEVRDDKGRTDLELRTAAQLAVIEAKRGWLRPDRQQLAAYAPRVHAAGRRPRYPVGSFRRVGDTLPADFGCGRARGALAVATASRSP